MRAILLVALILTGCVGAPAAPPPAGAPVAPAFHLRWDLSGCRELTAVFDVDTATLQAALPAGFQAGGGGSPGKSTTGIDAFACANDTSYASYWAVVTPPSALEGDAKSWYVKWDPLVAPDTARALAGVGSIARTGGVRYQDPAPTPAAGTSVAVTLDGVGEIDITVGPGPSLPTGGSSSLREFTTASDGRVVVWDATLAQQGSTLTAGVAMVPAGSMPAKMYGDTRIPVRIGLASSDLTNATITLATLPG